jgi:predicted small lipoprotein YifL
MKPHVIVLLGVSALALAACGKQGVLERPAPMFNNAQRAAYEAERAAASAQANQPSRPNSVRENIDPATTNATSKQSPIKGTSPDPFGGPSGPGFPNSGPGRE